MKKLHVLAVSLAVLAASTAFAASVCAATSAPVASLPPLVTVPGGGPAVALPVPEDPAALLAQVFSAVGSHNWLAAIPLLLIGLIYALRTYGAQKWAWLATNRAGAALSLASGLLAALFAAASLPGSHTIVQVLLAGVAVFATNQALWLGGLKKLLAPSGADLAQDAERLASAKGSAVAASASQSSTAAADALNKVGLQ